MFSYQKPKKIRKNKKIYFRHFNTNPFSNIMSNFFNFWYKLCFLGSIEWLLLFSMTRNVFILFSHSESGHFAHARIKQHALNQALHISYEKIVFDTRVRKWFFVIVCVKCLLYVLMCRRKAVTLRLLWRKKGYAPRE